MSNQPIGIFDSGIGGTSIFKEIKTLLPYENIIYLADSKNAPYGNKTEEEILQLSLKNVKLLLQKNCKLIVVACNTATTNSITYLRKNYSIPFVGIEPAIKPASLQSKSKSIGILATKGTLSSTLFHETSDLYAKNVTIIERVGEGLVPLIEAGKLNSDEIRELLKTFTKPMIEAQIDYLVLGCTHYPYLIPELKKILPEHVKIIDSGLAVAKQIKTLLETYNLINTSLNSPKIQFFTNASVGILDNVLDKKFSVKPLKF
ncbi:MAG: glutamate racemase [Winogradskyella sp.]|uniref:glutamate racemase n=1 Tax=Winogradskyella sp. TaxID=1883156 RepID=UPI0018291C60|nr:glutamate racemase [Winogradskyella sp.]MBT8245012.1 glutamate racemase [Winogradskyella sp.]NNK22146.1 glutamate racemase [Winogradskyella sp.]